MVLPRLRRADSRSGSALFNLIVLAAAILAAFVAWIAIGELIGDVFQSEGDGGVVLDVVLFVLSTLYVSLLLLFLFVPGFALFLLSLRLVDRRWRLSSRGRQLVAVAFEPAHWRGLPGHPGCSRGSGPSVVRLVVHSRHVGDRGVARAMAAAVGADLTARSERRLTPWPAPALGNDA